VEEQEIVHDDSEQTKLSLHIYCLISWSYCWLRLRIQDFVLLCQTILYKDHGFNFKNNHVKMLLHLISRKKNNIYTFFVSNSSHKIKGKNKVKEKQPKIIGLICHLTQIKARSFQLGPLNAAWNYCWAVWHSIKKFIKPQRPLSCQKLNGRETPEILNHAPNGFLWSLSLFYFLFFYECNRSSTYSRVGIIWETYLEHDFSES